jgi:hypothetical protein
MVSSTWSHNKQAAGCVKLYLDNWLAIQDCFLTASHKKILHLRGAQDLQILLQGANLMDPKKNELYAALLE